VKRDIEVILFTLKRWQEPTNSSTTLQDDAGDFIHGFDTFIDQVSEESRAFAIHYGTQVSQE
jgi:hypothetical protein